MKTYYTNSDCGSLLLGNETFSMRLFNRYGDGENKVLVFGSVEEYTAFTKKQYGELRWHEAFTFEAALRGVFNLYSDDCSDMRPDDVKTKFNGDYMVYLRNMDYEPPTFAFVKR